MCVVISRLLLLYILFNSWIKLTFNSSTCKFGEYFDGVCKSCAALFLMVDNMYHVFNDYCYDDYNTKFPTRNRSNVLPGCVEYKCMGFDEFCDYQSELCLPCTKPTESNFKSWSPCYFKAVARYQSVLELEKLAAGQPSTAPILRHLSVSSNSNALIIVFGILFGIAIVCLILAIIYIKKHRLHQIPVNTTEAPTETPSTGGTPSTTAIPLNEMGPISSNGYLLPSHIEHAVSSSGTESHYYDVENGFATHELDQAPTVSPPLPPATISTATASQPRLAAYRVKPEVLPYPISGNISSGKLKHNTRSEIPGYDNLQMALKTIYKEFNNDANICMIDVNILLTQLRNEGVIDIDEKSHIKKRGEHIGEEREKLFLDVLPNKGIEGLSAMITICENYKWTDALKYFEGKRRLLETKGFIYFDVDKKSYCPCE